MTVAPPTDEEVRRGLEERLHVTVELLGRAPYPYATSFPLEEVHARTEDGRVLHLILKDLTWDRLLDDALRTKPRFLYEPRRSIETYRCTLAGSDLGDACYAAHADDATGRYWLLLEKAPGVELWQIGELDTWAAASRWLARFHLRFARRGDDVLADNPHLLRYDEDLLRTWPERAMAATDDSTRRLGLEHVASRYGKVVDTLRSIPATFVHGELYPSNVLVDDRQAEVGVWPVDWEMAGVGPAYLDLVALTAGWDLAQQGGLITAYLDELGAAPWRREGNDLERVLDCCRLHYALQWLGWADGWSPPPEHARDWAGDALAAVERPSHE